MPLFYISLGGWGWGVVFTRTRKGFDIGGLPLHPLLKEVSFMQNICVYLCVLHVCAHNPYIRVVLHDLALLIFSEALPYVSNDSVTILRMSDTPQNKCASVLFKRRLCSLFNIMVFI